jgi:hypothetical protein
MAARRRRAASLGLVATGAIAFAALGKIRQRSDECPC